MKASASIKAFIKEMEGLRLSAYKCPSGVMTIGYGHTGKDVTPTMRITKQRADELFDADLARFEKQLADAMRRDGINTLTQGQYDALVSFAFNVGMNALHGSTLWRKLKADAGDASIVTEFGRWVYGTRNGRKVVLPGLVQRRAREAKMWEAN